MILFLKKYKRLKEENEMLKEKNSSLRRKLIISESYKGIYHEEMEKSQNYIEKLENNK